MSLNNNRKNSRQSTLEFEQLPLHKTNIGGFHERPALRIEGPSLRLVPISFIVIVDHAMVAPKAKFKAL